MIKINGSAVKIERFPDETLRINIANPKKEVVIEWLFEKDEEMALYFVTKHLRDRFDIKKITLYMPYIPNARMDRVKNDDEVFTLKYFAEFINSLHFDKVIVRDAHSDASLSMINNIVCEPIAENINALCGRLLEPQKDILFYPDAGSHKRYSGQVNFPCAYGIKNRDWQTGKILGLEIEGKLPQQPFNTLIVDDIVSRGGTLLRAAIKLKNAGACKIYIYVTHCENSILEGKLIDSGLIEKIYTTKSIFTKKHSLIEIIGDDKNEKL